MTGALDTFDGRCAHCGGDLARTPRRCGRWHCSPGCMMRVATERRAEHRRRGLCGCGAAPDPGYVTCSPCRARRRERRAARRQRRRSGYRELFRQMNSLARRAGLDPDYRPPRYEHKPPREAQESLLDRIEEAFGLRKSG